MSLPGPIAIDCSPACGQPTGVGRYVRDLVAGLHGRGVAVVGVYQGHRGALPAAFGRWCTALERYDLLGGRIGAWLRLGGILHRRECVLYHSTSTIAVPPRWWDGAVMGTVHDCIPLSSPHLAPARQRRLFRSLLGSLLARAELLACPSECSASEVRRLGWAGPLRVIPHGIAVPVQPPRPATAPPGRYLLTIGAIEPRKGLDRLAAALARLGADRPPWIHLGPVRHDPHGTLVSALAAAGCRRLGFVPDAERDAWLAHAWALAQPSASEGFGYPPLEAMACGVPVLAHPAGALPEVLGEAGWWVDDAVGAWAAAITDLARDAGRHRGLASAGLARSARFTFAAMVDAHLSAYEEAYRCASR